MRDKQAFKRGFLRKLASVGMTPSQLEAVMEKRGTVLEWLNAALSAGTTSAGLGLGAALTGGALLGAIAQVASSADDDDVDDVKVRELADEFRWRHRQINERLARARKTK